MRKTTIIMTLLTIAFTAAAQSPKMLGENHALLRIPAAKVTKYVLLPVQEKEEIANIRVITNNELRQTLNVRLAVDKVDYYVPLDIKRYGAGDVLLDINFHGDRRKTGAVE